MVSISHSPLQQIIIEQMQLREEKSIPFEQYMALCLYEPTYGYYRRDAVKIGKEGDFYTSSSIGTVMGKIIARAIAKQCIQYEASPCIQIVEWGGGNGRLAKHLLDELKRSSPSLYDRLQWVAIEGSPYHLQLQKEQLSEHWHKVHVPNSDDGSTVNYEMPTFVLANELLDAFPVSRVRYTGENFLQCYVAWNERNGQFVEQWKPIQEGRLLNYVEKYKHYFRPHQRADIQLDAPEWLMKIGQQMTDGAVLVIDYGDIAEELYASHRMDGTLLCYRNHRAYDNPYIHPGEQDITAHVNFTDLLEVAQKLPFTEVQLRSQKQFLVDEGIMDLLVEHHSSDPFSEEAKMNRAVRQLLLSDQMSELFKVFMATKKAFPAQ